MVKHFITSMIIGTLFFFFAPLSSVQAISSGCTAINGTSATGGTPYTFNGGSFSAGEIITVTLLGTGTFDISVNGIGVVANVTAPNVFQYAVPLDIAISVSVTVTGGSTDTSMNISCVEPAISTPSTGDVIPDVFTAEDGTICHYPPNNPAAAQTLTVSEADLPAYLAEGATRGACPEGVETRNDIPGANVTIFILYETDTIQVYGNCDTACEEVTSTPITLLVDLDSVVLNDGDDSNNDNDGTFIEINNPEDFGFQTGETTVSGLRTVIYYLHPDPTNPGVGVFQINIYQNDTLISDSTLVFLTTGGDIVLWSDQKYWD
ncbi:MAG: hypothetical protein AAFR81_23125 [Chloroflexota bacterium]